MDKPLHSLQVEILKTLYKRKMGVYKLSVFMKIPTPSVEFHMNRLYKMGLLKKMKKKNGRGFVYTTNKRKVKMVEEKDKTMLYIKVM